MLQRIQSVFLIMSAILMALFLFLPLWQSAGAESGNYEMLFAFYKLNIVSTEPTPIYWPFVLSGAFAVLAIFTSIIEIFSYKNRMNQMKLGALNSLLLAGALISSVWWASDLQKELINGEPGKFMLGIFIPIIAIFLNLLANRFIRKDENLVRSMDRIR